VGPENHVIERTQAPSDECSGSICVVAVMWLVDTITVQVFYL